MQVPLDRLLRNYDIVRGAVGDAWLEQQSTRAALPHVNLADIHPLYTALRSSCDTALAEICELGEYLHEFKQDPAICQVISDLRSSKYPATLAELALAFRWQRAGASVALRPKVPSGEADYLARIANKDYTVEVSTFPHELFETKEFRLQTIIANCVKTAVNRRIPVAVKCIFSDVTANTIENEIRELTKRVLAIFLKNPAAPARLSNAYCEIAVESISETTEQNPFQSNEYSEIIDAREHGWTSVIHDVSYPATDQAPTIEALKQSERVEHGRLFFKFPDTTSDVYEKLKKKLKKELHQLAHIEAPRVVVLDASGVAPNIFALSQQSLYSAIAPIFRSAEELAALWIVVRKWTTAFRFRYFGLYMPNPDSVFQIPRSFLNALGGFEFKEDFITGRKFESRGFDYDVGDYQRRQAKPME